MPEALPAQPIHISQVSCNSSPSFTRRSEGRHEICYKLTNYTILTFANALDGRYPIKEVRGGIALRVADEGSLLFLLCKSPQLVGFSGKSSPLLLFNIV